MFGNQNIMQTVRMLHGNRGLNCTIAINRLGNVSIFLIIVT
jgi:hypothetical protein